VVVVSEFGLHLPARTAIDGTDHGHGSVMLGARRRACAAGQVVGEQVQMTAVTLFRNRDYAVLNEYRSVLGGIFQRQWGLSDSQLKTVFPGFRATRWAWSKPLRSVSKSLTRLSRGVHDRAQRCAGGVLPCFTEKPSPE